MKIFLTSYSGKAIDKIIPKLSKSPKDLKALFITTASNPYPDKPWQDEDRENLTKRGFILTDYDLVGKTEEDVRKAVEENDVIFVEGGNTFYLLKYARESGFDKVMREQIGSDKIYIGASAGSYIATPDIGPTTWKRKKETYGVTDYAGLGLVPFTVFPHYSDEYKDMVETRKKELKYDLVTIRDDGMIEV